MESEASTATAGVHGAAPVSMTIDYDIPDLPHPQEGADAEMGDELSKDADFAPPEADMVDDDGITRDAEHSIALATDGDAEIAIDDDVVLASSAAPVDIPFSSVDAAAVSPYSAFSSAPVIPTTASTDANDLELAGEPALVTAEPAFPDTLPAEPIGTLMPEDLTLAGDPAVHPVEPLSSAESASETTRTAGATAEAALAEELDLVPNEDEATNEGLPETVVETARDHVDDGVREAASAEDAVEAANVKEATLAIKGDAGTREGDDEVHEGGGEAKETLEDSSSRPPVNKDPLLDVEVPARPPADPSSSPRGVPAVFLSMGAPYGWTTYSLFHPEQRAGAEADDHVKEDVELLLTEPAQHELYYQPLSKLFDTLRAQLEFLEHDGDELVLEFDEIGLAISEDNVYAREVTLFDFDRIHTGCQIPSRLHANLATQPRFSTGFNALALHIAGSIGASDAEEGLLGEGEYEEEEGDESATLQGDDSREEEDEEEDAAEVGELFDEEEAERAEEGPADDHDGPDSELVGAHVHEDEHEHAEDEFDLESALAQLDGDDVVAVIEGAQEDLLLAGGEGEVAAEGSPEKEREEAPVEAPAGAHEETQVGEEGEQGEVSEQQPEGEEAVVEEELPSEVAANSHAEEVEVPVGGVSEEIAALVGAGEGEPCTPVEAVEHVEEVIADDAATSEVMTEVGITRIAAVEELAANEVAAPAAAPPLDANSAELDTAAVPSTAADEPEAKSADVVIDYDDAFDGGPAITAPPVSPPATAVADELLAPLEPKRSREDDEQEGADEESAGDAKRPRLAEPVEVA